MKITITTLFLFVFFSVSKSQCTTEQDLSHAANIIKFDKDTWTSGSETFVVKVYAHLLEYDGIESPMTEAEIVTSITNLNTAFQGADIEFILDPCIDYVEENYVNEQSDGLDIYFGPASQTATSTFVGWGGRGSFDKSSITIRGRFLGVDDEPLALTNVLAHEVGHVFGLLHTFTNTADWLCFQQTGSAICSPVPQDEIHPEPVDYFNVFDLDVGSLTGDYIADTPSDPFNTFSRRHARIL